MAASSGLRAVTFPRSDAAFARAVHRALASEQIHTALHLEMALRPRYPHVRVHERGSRGESGVTWYVYRDTHFVVDVPG